MTTTSVGRNQEIELPLDLGEWVTPEVLVRWVEMLVGSLDWKNPELLDLLRRNPAFRPRPLLSLLLHAYALGQFSSAEIVEGCYRDPQLGRWFDGSAPAVKTLSLFRRQNRGLIRWGLMELLKRSFRQKYELGEGCCRRACGGIWKRWRSRGWTWRGTWTGPRRSDFSAGEMRAAWGVEIILAPRKSSRPGPGGGTPDATSV